MVVPAPLIAGPPFLTDDPEPTETGRWEIYGPYLEAAGKGADFEGSTGLEVNYGAAENLQLTIGLPAAFVHDANGLAVSSGDIEISAKYRFFHDPKAGVQLAIFPGISLPTAGRGMGAGHVTALLPVWGQVDFKRWSVFGGGGYAINPGPGNRDYWTGGIAVTRSLSDSLSLGVEVNRSGAGTIGGNPSTALGFGAIWQTKSPVRLLASGGATFEDHGGAAGFHMFAALGIDF